MSSTGKKWLVGCGIGCGLFLLLIGGVGTCGYFAVREVIDQADDINVNMAAMDSTFGDPTDYIPPVEGRLQAGRIETFITIREQMTPVRQQISQLITSLDGHGSGGVIAKIKAGIKFVPAILQFISHRNEALVQGGMGLGEYQHIYCLAYYGLLDKDPADGPGFSLINDDSGHDGFKVKGTFSSKDSTSVRTKRGKTIRRFINKTQLPILGNQLTALDADSALARSLIGWRDSLSAEADRMSDDDRRLPWQDGLPDRIGDSLEPYRDRLDSLYNPLTSGLEMGLTNNN